MENGRVAENVTLVMATSIVGRALTVHHLLLMASSALDDIAQKLF